MRLRYDSNPGVRLKALDSLGAFVKSDPRVRDVVLEALIQDSNPGVRTDALRLLDPVRADSSVRRFCKSSHGAIRTNTFARRLGLCCRSFPNLIRKLVRKCGRGRQESAEQVKRMEGEC